MRSALKILARRDAMTEEEWFELLEARREAMLPHLRDMTLRPLGDHPFLMREKTKPTKQHTSEKRYVLLGDDPHLKERGIYPDAGTVVDSRAHPHSVLKEILRFWGLTRNNKWVLIEIEEDSRIQKKGEEFYRITDVVGLKVEEKTAQEICFLCGTSPREIWEHLEGVVRDWTKHRKALYDTAYALEERFYVEKLLIGVSQSP